MAYNDRFSENDWADDSRCIVCKTNLGKSVELVCSVTCEEIQEFTHREPLMDWEEDCV